MPKNTETERNAEILRLAMSGVLPTAIGRRFGIGAGRIRAIVAVAAAKARRVALDRGNGKVDVVRSAIKAEVFRGR